MLTPEQRYQKALSIPVGEWAKLSNDPMQDLRVEFLPSHKLICVRVHRPSYCIVDIMKGGIGSQPDNREMEQRVADFIDSYAPEVELVWEQNTEGDPFRLNCGPLEIVVYPEPDNDSGDWEWDLWMGACIIRNRVEESCDSAISAAKAAAGELIKSVLK